MDVLAQCVQIMEQVGKDWVANLTCEKQLHAHRDALLSKFSLAPLVTKVPAAKVAVAAATAAAATPAATVAEATSTTVQEEDQPQPKKRRTATAGAKAATAKKPPGKPPAKPPATSSAGSSGKEPAAMTTPRPQMTKPRTMADLGVAMPRFLGDASDSE